MTLNISFSLAPMEAKSVDELPSGEEWQYEPKWDGFRCLIFKNGNEVLLQSKSGQPLARYFPDLVAALAELKPKQFALDGEIVIPVSGRLCFDDLLMRVHPAESRVRMLAEKHPAMLVIFDLLADARGKSLIEQDLQFRRTALADFVRTYLEDHPSICLSPATIEISVANKWFKAKGTNLDGIIAKRLDLPYCSGNREGMVKVKHQRTADCVVGGIRYLASKKGVIGSLLLGLYDAESQLNHVGFAASFSATERAKLAAIVEPLKGGNGFSGRGPGGPSRWNGGVAKEWVPLKPELVAEVGYDHFTGGRFRHGTQLIRWRPDKKPAACTMEQIDQSKGNVLKLLGRQTSSQRK
jgi:ATP-dependent DNA ligase